MSEKYTSYNDYENALIAKAREQAQKEWQAIEYRQRLANLHVELGFKSAKDLIKTLQEIAGSAKKSATKRVRITPEIAARVKVLKAEGKGPTEISRLLGISVPSVYNTLKKG